MSKILIVLKVASCFKHRRYYDELHPDYIVDENLNRRVVILPYSEWENIIEEMEELDDG